jgi:hypothetical protein
VDNNYLDLGMNKSGFVHTRVVDYVEVPIQPARESGIFFIF